MLATVQMNVESDGFRIGSDSLTLHDSFWYYFSALFFLAFLVTLRTKFFPGHSLLGSMLLICWEPPEICTGQNVFLFQEKTHLRAQHLAQTLMARFIPKSLEIWVREEVDHRYMGL